MIHVPVSHVERWVFLYPIFLNNLQSKVIMDLKRCLEILELKNATSIGQVKHAYRELVQVWHPDRFPTDSPIKKRADEKMHEINMAYEKLVSFLSAEHQQDKLSLLGVKKIAGSAREQPVSTRTAKNKTNYTNGNGETKAAAARVRPAIIPTAAGRNTTISGKYVVL
ncbi:MAG: J domain-containing protein, partial [Desulfobacterales bacterium]